jgi:hypothetical protein
LHVVWEESSIFHYFLVVILIRWLDLV